MVELVEQHLRHLEKTVPTDFKHFDRLCIFLGELGAALQAQTVVTAATEAQALTDVVAVEVEAVSLVEHLEPVVKVAMASS